MVKYKEGVPRNLVLPMLSALPIIEAVFSRFGVDFVVTSTTDGKHSDGSLHHLGLAADFRTRDLRRSEQLAVRYMVWDLLQEFAQMEKLTGRFDVVLEKDHLHVEYDRRRKYASAKPWSC